VEYRRRLEGEGRREGYESIAEAEEVIQGSERELGYIYKTGFPAQEPSAGNPTTNTVSGGGGFAGKKKVALGESGVQGGSWTGGEETQKAARSEVDLVDESAEKQPVSQRQNGRGGGEGSEGP